MQPLCSTIVCPYQLCSHEKSNGNQSNPLFASHTRVSWQAFKIRRENLIGYVRENGDRLRGLYTFTQAKPLCVFYLVNYDKSAFYHCSYAVPVRKLLKCFLKLVIHTIPYNNTFCVVDAKHSK